MINLSPSQIHLLKLLGDGYCHSGSELGKALGITRSAIWKQINQLIEIGVPIQSIPQHGYQLANPLILLNEQLISQLILEKKLVNSFEFHLFTSIDSTNRYLKDLAHRSAIAICCAEIQTQGRGRFGRQWHSPFGENIYCSSRWQLNYDITKLSGLSLVTSLATLSALQKFYHSPDIKIKWPNDIYWKDKKLCGSLIEIQAESNSNAQVIIGIGLNVNTDTVKHPLPDKPWCSLYEITHQYFDRNLIIAEIISSLELYLGKFMEYDLNAFMEEWEQADYLLGKKIQLTQSAKVLTGKACGINQLGQLILEDERGIKHMLSSGDTSLQGAL